VRRQTPASVCVPTQPVAAVLCLCCAVLCLWCAIANVVVLAPVPVLRHGCCTVRMLCATDRPHAHKTLSHSASLSYVQHFWYSTYSRSARIQAVRARVLRWQLYRRCGLSAPATAAWYPSRKPPSYPSSPAKPPHHIAWHQRGTRQRSSERTTVRIEAPRRLRIAPETCRTRPLPHDPRQDTLQLTTCTITRASADVRMRACRAQKVSVLCR